SPDRVFSHALNTVNKIRTGSEKPPAAMRLKLYGLYKQAMEGDVDGILPRPSGDSDAAKRAREKYDAWQAQAGLSRTEAKRRYISTLIDTMHKYAAPTPDARELVSELEFVWDQIKSNVPSSSSSSPLQTMGTGVGLQDAPSYATLDDTGQSREGRSSGRKDDAPMRVLSPMSESQEEDLDDDDEDENAEFVDAPDSQYNATSPSPIEPPARVGKDKGCEDVSRQRSSDRPPPTRRDSNDQKWRKRVEANLIKLTAEVSALREQLESRRLFSRGRRYSIYGWFSWVLWGLVKFIGFNILALCVALLWMRRKQDRRLEGAIRVLLGDAVAEVRRV
ncbi:hypothetical protein NA57DRAFT_25750, partial [Rhizodiscina lignyota]